MLPRLRRKDNRTQQQPPKKVDGFRLRAMVMIAFILVAFTGVQVRLFTVGLTPVGEPDGSSNTTLQSVPLRGDILDRQGNLLATTLTVQSLYADPANILNVHDAVQKIRTVLPDLDAAWLQDRLTRDSRFVWLKRDLRPREVYQVNALGLPGLGFREEKARIYPHAKLAAHVLGNTNYQGDGIAGVEASFNDELSQGKTIQLTIDSRLQAALHETLQHTLVKSGAKGVWGVTVDPRTGEIMALVSLPDFDPNHYGDATPAQWRNRVTSNVYEMGSIFKLFTMAAAIQDNNLKLDDKFDCTRPISLDHFRIHDSSPHNAWLSVRDIFTYSSNIGAARIADAFGPEEQQAFFEKLKLLEPLDVDFPAAARPLYPDPWHWKRIQTMSMAYGHGIAVSPLHMVEAAAAVVYDGRWRKPQIRLGVKSKPSAAIVSPETIKKLHELMAMVVDHGTGRRAKVAGYDVGGKTGTSEKIDNGQYLKDKHLASFIGVFPLHAPRLVTLIMVDEGYDGEAGGGTVAAPAFAKFTEQAANILGVPPTAAQGGELLADYIPAQPETHRVKRAGYETFGTYWASRR